MFLTRKKKKKRENLLFPHSSAACSRKKTIVPGKERRGGPTVTLLGGFLSWKEKKERKGGRRIRIPLVCYIVVTRKRKQPVEEKGKKGDRTHADHHPTLRFREEKKLTLISDDRRCTRRTNVKGGISLEEREKRGTSSIHFPAGQARGTTEKKGGREAKSFCPSSGPMGKKEEKGRGRWLIDSHSVFSVPKGDVLPEKKKGGSRCLVFSLLLQSFEKGGGGKGKGKANPPL